MSHSRAHGAKTQKLLSIMGSPKNTWNSAAVHGSSNHLFIPIHLPGLAPRLRLLDRQGWSILVAGALLLLISFTTTYGDYKLLQFGSVPAHDKVGLSLHLAAPLRFLAMLNWRSVYDIER